MRRRAPQQGRIAKRRRVNNYQQQRAVIYRQPVRRRNSRTGGFLGIEYKFLDCTKSFTTIANTEWQVQVPTSGSTGCISVPAQGDGESNRDGKNYAITSVHFKGAWKYLESEAATDPHDDIMCRLVLYIDTQTNGAVATGTDIMDSGATHNNLAFRNLQYSKRFKILYDKSMVVRPKDLVAATNSFSTGDGKWIFSFNKKFKVPMRVSCDGTTADVADCVDNCIGVAVCVDKANFLQLGYESRIRFVG